MRFSGSLICCCFIACHHFPIALDGAVRAVEWKLDRRIAAIQTSIEPFRLQRIRTRQRVVPTRVRRHRRAAVDGTEERNRLLADDSVHLLNLMGSNEILVGLLDAWTKNLAAEAHFDWN